MFKEKLLNLLKIKEKKWYYDYHYLKIKKKFKIFDKFGLNKNSIVIDIG